MSITRTNTFERATKQEIRNLMRDLLCQKRDKWVWLQCQPNADIRRLYSLLRELDMLERAVELLQE